MQYLITARDGKGASGRRAAARPSHLENMERYRDNVVCAGGILDDAGRPVGSVLIMDFGSKELLDGYIAGEPYIAQGVWESVRVEPMNVVLLKGERVGK